MSEPTPSPAEQASESATESGTPPDVRRPSLRERFRDPARVKEALYDLTVWFLFGGLVTTMLSQFSPGYPILVGTESIPPGLYWVDRRVSSYFEDDYVTFPFKPTQAWISERYRGNQRVFTKQVKAIEGDTVSADEQGLLRVCRTRNTAVPVRCEELGRPRDVDSQGRAMTPWLAPRQQYVLQAGELWVHGAHPKSLDSRYYGPIHTSIVKGRATPWILRGA